MAAELLVDSKIEFSKQLAKELTERGAPLLAVYWEFHEEVDRWTLMLVPSSPEDQHRLIKEATSLLVQPPYRSAFSVSDPLIDAHQIERAKALGAYIRVQPYVGRRIDTMFTGGEYFEKVVPVYFKPELLTRLAVAPS
jgi:hypothetical protein